MRDNLLLSYSTTLCIAMERRLRNARLSHALHQKIQNHIKFSMAEFFWRHYSNMTYVLGKDQWGKWLKG